MNPNFLAPDSSWFFAVVENRFDDKMRGRVRIRVNGIHPSDKSLVPDEDLPWAFPIQTLMSAATGQIGMTPHGLMEGSIVWGIFTDGADGQMPVIMGTLQNGPLPPLAIGTQSLPKGSTTGIEPPTPYGAEYPFNKVYQSESGHAVELDDTPGKERLQVFHRIGTYWEMGPDGNYVLKVIGDGYQVFVKDNNIFTQGETNIYAKGNLNIEADNDANLNISGSVNLSVAEDVRIKASKFYVEADEINLKGHVITDAIDAASITAGTGDIGSINADSIKAGHTTSAFTNGSGSAASAEDSTGSGLSAPQPRNISVFVPTVEDYHAFVNDDIDSPTAFLQEGVTTPADLTQGAVEPAVQASNTAAPITTICGEHITPGQNLDSIQLTPNFTVGRLSSFAAVTHFRVVAQAGLDEGEIVCNLKLLAQNVLEPLLAHFPDAFVTSGFRSPATTTSTGSISQHCKGQAADIQFHSLAGLGAGEAVRRAYADRAQWVLNNIAFDQLLLEYKSTGTKMPWLHISFNKDNLRRQPLTLSNGHTVAHGLSVVLP